MKKFAENQFDMEVNFSSSLYCLMTYICEHWCLIGRLEEQLIRISRLKLKFREISMISDIWKPTYDISSYSTKIRWNRSEKHFEN